MFGPKHRWLYFPCWLDASFVILFFCDFIIFDAKGQHFPQICHNNSNVYRDVTSSQVGYEKRNIVVPIIIIIVPTVLHHTAPATGVTKV